MSLSCKLCPVFCIEARFSTELAFLVGLKFGLALKLDDKGLSQFISAEFSEDFEGDRISDMYLNEEIALIYRH